jgi:hypothetical protein
MGIKKKFKTVVIGQVVTGLSLGAPFGDTHEAAEFIMGHPIWTHEFASKDVWTKLRDKVLKQLPDWPSWKSEWKEAGWNYYIKQLEAKYGPEVEIEGGDEARTESPMQSLARIAGSKPVIAIQLVKTGEKDETKGDL